MIKDTISLPYQNCNGAMSQLNLQWKISVKDVLFPVLISIAGNRRLNVLKVEKQQTLNCFLCGGLLAC